MTLDLTGPTAVLLATAEALERTGLDVAAYGGLVLASYGTPRETIDADWRPRRARSGGQPAGTVTGLSPPRPRGAGRLPVNWTGAEGYLSVVPRAFDVAMRTVFPSGDWFSSPRMKGITCMLVRLVGRVGTLNA